MSKPIQLLRVPGLLAVIGDSEGYYTVKVSYIRLMEKGDEVPVIPYYTGKLTGVDEVPNFIGIAESESRAEGVWLRSLTEEQFQAHMQKIKGQSKERRTFDWIGGGCAKSATMSEDTSCLN